MAFKIEDNIPAACSGPSPCVCSTSKLSCYFETFDSRRGRAACFFRRAAGSLRSVNVPRIQLKGHARGGRIPAPRACATLVRADGCVAAQRIPCNGLARFGVANTRHQILNPLGRRFGQ
jgi:hypothetical protein